LALFGVAAQRRSNHLDSRRGSGNEIVPLRAVERDPDRNTLGQPHPVESRIDVGEEGFTGTAIAIFDPGRDAFHSSSQHAITAQQPHIDCIAEVNTRQPGLLEVALDAQRAPR
jgi:hypothetical protein